MKDQSTEGAAIAVIFLGICLYLALSWFAKLIGVDLDTAGSVALRLMISGILGVASENGKNPFIPRSTKAVARPWRSFAPRASVPQP